MNPQTIFVIDDDPHIRDVVAQTLMDEGYDVIAYGDGQQALAALVMERPALILLDLMMPTISGWEMLAQFKTLPHLATMPVVLLSASRTLEETARNAGVAGFVAKPFELDLLVQTVAQHLAHSP